jgi:hypothetical protein
MTRNVHGTILSQALAVTLCRQVGGTNSLDRNGGLRSRVRLQQSSKDDAQDRTDADHLEHVDADHPKHRTASNGFDTD